MQRQHSNGKRLVVRLAVLLGTCLGATVAHADDGVNMADARKQFEAGVNLLDDPDGAKYEEAYHAFKKAYALSNNPKVLGNVGFCAFHLERDGEAIDAYTAYLRDATDIDERERAQIRRDLATLTSTVARVRIQVNHPATSFVLVDSRAQTRGPSVENSYPFEGKEISLRIRPGQHTFRIKTTGAESLPLEVTVEPASEIAPVLTFPPPRSVTEVKIREAPSIAGPAIVAVTGVVSIGAGVAAGLMARSKQAQIANSCPNDLCPVTYDLDGEREKAKALGTIADVTFVTGGALLGTALLWYVLLPKSAAKSSAMAASVMCSGQGCGVQLVRGF